MRTRTEMGVLEILGPKQISAIVLRNKDGRLVQRCVGLGFRVEGWDVPPHTSSPFILGIVVPPPPPPFLSLNLKP